MTTAGLDELRERLYEAYASQHVGHIRPLLPPPEAGPVVDLSRGRGDLVRLLQTDGYDPESIDISPEQTALADAAGVTKVRQGDFRAIHQTFVARKGVVVVKSADS